MLVFNLIDALMWEFWDLWFLFVQSRTKLIKLALFSSVKSFMFDKVKKRAYLLEASLFEDSLIFLGN